MWGPSVGPEMALGAWFAAFSVARRELAPRGHISPFIFLQPSRFLFATFSVVTLASLPQAPAPTLYISGFHLLAERAACCAQWTSETGDIELLTSPSQLSCKIGSDRTSGDALFRLFVPIASNASPNNRKTPYTYASTLYMFRSCTLCRWIAVRQRRHA